LWFREVGVGVVVSFSAPLPCVPAGRVLTKPVAAAVVEACRGVEA